jgi:hypothetical protein
MLVIPHIMNKNLHKFAQCSIIHLSPLFSSKEIDLARSRSGLFFYPLRCKGKHNLNTVPAAPDSQLTLPSTAAARRS